MNKRNSLARFSGSLERINSASESTGVDCNVGIKNPKDVVHGRTISAHEIVYFGVNPDVVFA